MYLLNVLEIILKLVSNPVDEIAQAINKGYENALQEYLQAHLIAATAPPY